MNNKERVIITRTLEQKSTMIGGRPQDIGCLTRDDNGKYGIFIGYIDRIKILITEEHLNELFRVEKKACEVDVVFRPIQSLVERIKPKFF